MMFCWESAAEPANEPAGSWLSIQSENMVVDIAAAASRATYDKASGVVELMRQVVSMVCCESERG